MSDELPRAAPSVAERATVRATCDGCGGSARVPTWATGQAPPTWCSGCESTTTWTAE